MKKRPVRSLADIDADLRSCRSIRSGAQGELEKVRRRLAELLNLKATLLMTIEIRGWQADRLLDERLQAVEGGQLVADLRWDERPRLAGV